MAKNYTTMRTNVKNNVMDTSASASAFDNLVGVYLNMRYRDVLRRINWNVIDEDYTFNTVAGTQDYVLASDFGKELYCLDTTNKSAITPITMQEWIDNYGDSYTDQGTVVHYITFEYMTTDTPAARGKKIRLVRVPSAVITVALPYIVEPAALSSDTDNVIIPCEDALEYGATADAWRYKRQFAKAGEFEKLYERAISILIWNKENSYNQPHLFTPITFNRDDLV